MAGRRTLKYNKQLITITTALIVSIIVTIATLLIIHDSSPTSTSIFASIAIGIMIVLVSVGLIIINTTLSRNTESIKEQQRTIGEQVSRISSQQPKNALEKKREQFLNLTGITFHYVNRSQITDLYDQVFKEPVIEKLTTEEAGETDLSFKAQLPNSILGGGIDNKDSSKLTRDMRVPEVPLSGKFLRFQRESIKKNQVVLGLEEVDIKDTELNAFQETIDTLKDRFGLEVEQTLLNAKMAELKAKAAESTLVRLENATGWVLIEGKFQIQEQLDTYRFTYRHPVNGYLKDTEPVTFFFSIPINSLEEYVKGNYALSVGDLIPLKVYGQVWRPVDRSSNKWNLQINPTAVYQ